ncbi:hypothetical protein SAMN05444339_11044 [Loktanella atrilutea]|uniref:Uncharacterized protein n=1 Tax=Loktanella atrilutea TaxID=366533 RepID=A0A1M5DL79_LOKAT|nr:hypothetical protein [Loktanella atrilutea]SHF67733.1 hypothetical protein SAMN05444339_11044 [Loktanella atrilutea]
MTFDLNIKTAEQLSAETLEAKRNGMRAFKRAMRQSLKLFPSTTHDHLLAQLDDAVAALSDYHPAKDAWADVVEFVRMNEDVLAFGPLFGLDDQMMDTAFTVAMALQGGASEADALSLAGL